MNERQHFEQRFPSLARLLRLRREGVGVAVSAYAISDACRADRRARVRAEHAC